MRVKCYTIEMSEVILPMVKEPNAYIASARMLSEVVPPFFGISLPDKTQKSWRVVMNAIKQVDTVVDKIPVSQGQSKRMKADEIITVIQKNLRTEQQEPDEFIRDNGLDALVSNMKRYPSEVREQFLQKLAALKDATLDVSSSTSLNEYIVKRRAEGRLTAELLLTLTDAETRQYGGYDRFADYIVKISEVATLVDSMVDWEEDHAKGEVSIPLTRVHKLQMTRHILGDMFCLIPHTHPRLCQQLISAALKA